MTSYIIVVPTVWLVLAAAVPVIALYLWAVNKGCRRWERWAKDRLDNRMNAQIEQIRQEAKKRD